MQFFIISHFFFMKVSLDIKMDICFLEKKRRRILEISFLPSVRAKLLYSVCNEIPCRTSFMLLTVKKSLLMTQTLLLSECTVTDIS